MPSTHSTQDRCSVASHHAGTGDGGTDVDLLRSARPDHCERDGSLSNAQSGSRGVDQDARVDHLPHCGLLVGQTSVHSRDRAREVYRSGEGVRDNCGGPSVGRHQVVLREKVIGGLASVIGCDYGLWRQVGDVCALRLRKRPHVFEVQQAVETRQAIHFYLTLVSQIDPYRVVVGQLLKPERWRDAERLAQLLVLIISIVQTKGSILEHRHSAHCFGADTVPRHAADSPRPVRHAASDVRLHPDVPIVGVIGANRVSILGSVIEVGLFVHQDTHNAAARLRSVRGLVPGLGDCVALAQVLGELIALCVRAPTGARTRLEAQDEVTSIQASAPGGQAARGIVQDIARSEGHPVVVVIAPRTVAVILCQPFVIVSGVTKGEGTCAAVSDVELKVHGIEVHVLFAASGRGPAFKVLLPRPGVAIAVASSPIVGAPAAPVDQFVVQIRAFGGGGRGVPTRTARRVVYTNFPSAAIVTQHPHILSLPGYPASVLNRWWGRRLLRQRGRQDQHQGQ